MGITVRTSLMLVAYTTLIIQTNADIAATDCSANQDADCTVDNSVCDTVDGNCKCDDTSGYRIDPDDIAACTLILGSTCSVAGDCTLSNDQCDTTCKCADGYTENSGQTACIENIAATDCSANQDADCTVPNSVCDTGAGNCKCDDTSGYRIDPDNNAACTLILGSTCSVAGDCTLISNSQCDTTCKCADGYTGNSGQTACIESSAERIGVSSLTVMMLGIVLAFLHMPY